MTVTRRRTLKLLGGTVGAAALPLNFACEAEGGAFARNSTFVPTPGQPLTPTGQFFVTYCCGMPEILERTDWKLRLVGLVDREVTLGFDDLAALPEYERDVTLECVGNDPDGGLISSARFTGVRLGDVLDLAGLSSHARGLKFMSMEGYASLLSRAVGEDDGPMLAWAMNGAPLLPEFGAPVRAVFPARYGTFSVKWLDSIAATRQYAPYGAFRGLGFSIAGVKPVRSRIDGLRDGGQVAAGETHDVTGLAVTSGAGVARVEVRDAGDWRPAELTYNTVADPRGEHLWTLWRYRWTPQTTGRHVLSVRAFDTDGETQSADARYPYDSGTIHSIRVVVV